MDDAVNRINLWLDGGQDPELTRGFERWKQGNVAVDKRREPDIIKVPDVAIPKSLGAKSANHEVRLPDGEYVRLAEGSTISNIKVIAGKGRQRQIDEIIKLIERYGGSEYEWQKLKGIGYVDYDGERCKTELHWYEEPSIGRVDFKVKTRDGRWIIDE